MQPDRGRKILWLIEIVGAYGLAHVVAQLRPRIALRENRLRQASRAKTAVSFLCDLENQFGHGWKFNPGVVAAQQRDGAPDASFRVINLASYSTKRWL